MNHCRLCGETIPSTFNWWPALRCAKCRARKDEELSILIEETSWLDSENDYLRSRFFDTENSYTKLNREHQKLKKRYDMLWKRHSEDLKRIQKINRENEKLRKWAERLFAKIHELENQNAEKTVDYERLKDAFNDVLYDK